MEDGGLTLEQSLAAHKRGLELARLCREHDVTGDRDAVDENGCCAGGAVV